MRRKKMFNNITEEMILSLNPLELRWYSYIKQSINKNVVTSPLVVKRFSDLSFSLARKSMKTNSEIKVAEQLLEIFNHYLNSSLISIDTKNEMAALIGETKLDFYYASGNHDISSLRLSRFLITNN